MQIVVVLCVRNEAAFLLDWLAHHLAAGVSHVVALSNDCQDGTDLMLDRLQQMGHVTHLRNDGPYDKAGIQFKGLKRADGLSVVREADWLLAIDIDEFVNVHVGNRTLPALIDATPDVDAITLTWRLFGNAGIVNYVDTPVPQQFTRAAPEILQWPWRTAMFKTLYRNTGVYRKLGVHRPRDPDPAHMSNLVWVDSNGTRLDDRYHTKRIFNAYDQAKYRLVQLNHYALGAMESYVLKSDRGRAVHSDDVLGMDYWVERNWSDAEDRSILTLAGVSEWRQRLAEDPILNGLHQDAVRWRRSRLAELLRHEPHRALFARLLMTPPTRAITQEAARVLAAYARAGRQS